MKKITLLISFLLIGYNSVSQSKAGISAVGSELITTLNDLTQTDDMGLSVIFTITGIQYANTVSIGVGATSLTADGITTIFEVVKENKEYYLVEQNIRSKVEGGTVSVFVHLPGKPEEYKNKYTIIRITDKEGNASPAQAILIH